MAGRRVYGGSNTAVMEALLSSGSFSSGFHGSRSMMNFEEFQGDTSKGSFCCPLELKETCDDDLDDSFHQPEKKRRLTADQVHSLEKTFELENKLEPERKIKLAKDLGLHPRQVAIWFQNRRARWKTKQLEKDYEVLKSSYNLLKADYDDLLEEKEKLKAEVLVLTDKLLVKEKKGNLDFFEPNSMLHKASKAEPDSVSEAKESEAPIMVCKQEDLSSADSAVSDSDSPRCSGVEASLYELAESTRVFEAEQYSDLSYVEEDKDGKGCSFLKLEDSSGNYGFPGEDQAYWFWPF